MGESRWIRLDIAWDDSEWLADLPWEVRAIWPVLLCHVKANGMNGRCRATSDRRFAAAHDLPVTALRALLTAATEHGALSIEGGSWVVSKWSEYQRADNTNADRQRRHRLNLRNAVTGPDNAVTGVTSRVSNGSNAPDNDKDNDIDTLYGADSATEPAHGSAPAKTPEPSRQRKKFVPPTNEEADAHFAELGYAGEGGRFVDFYASKGWKVGNATMVDWKAAARNWVRGKQPMQAVVAPRPRAKDDLEALTR